jgi:organic radical activating enzyme
MQIGQYSALEHGKDFYKDHFVVNWTFFNICNFSCTYCVPKLYDGSLKGIDLDIVKRFIDLIFENKKDKKIFFEFTGGEITFYQHFKELFTYIKDRGGKTGIISNGSRSLDWWKEHSHLIDHACLSFHAEKGKTDHFYDVVAYLAAQSTVHVNIMMLPEKFDELYQLAQRLASEVSGISLAMQPLFDRFTGPMYNYKTEELHILQNPALPWGRQILHQGISHPVVFRGEMKKVHADGTSEIVDPTLLISRFENFWFGWKCFIGVENLVISPDGIIMRGLCGVGGIIGNIQDLDFKLPVEPVLCVNKRCTCAFDIMCTKKNV